MRNLVLCAVSDLITALQVEGLLGFCTFVKTQRVPPPQFYYLSHIKRIGEQNSKSTKGTFLNDDNNNNNSCPHLEPSYLPFLSYSVGSLNEKNAEAQRKQEKEDKSYTSRNKDGRTLASDVSQLQ